MSTESNCRNKLSNYEEENLQLRSQLKSLETENETNTKKKQSSRSLMNSKLKNRVKHYSAKQKKVVEKMKKVSTASEPDGGLGNRNVKIEDIFFK